MNLVILPVLLPMLTGLGALWWGRPSRGRRGLVGGSAVLQLGVALALLASNWAGHPLVLGVGWWTYRVGIVLVVDLLAAIMVCLSTLTALACLIYGFVEQPPAQEHPLRLPLLQFLIMGINQSFCTGDLFNLFVAFEVMLISSYALLTLEADNWDIKQAFPYLAINLVGGTLFLCAAGLAYVLFGTLNFADIAARSAALQDDPRVLALTVLVAVVFCIKAGAFPLGYWLPNSYPTLPIPLAALYAGMLSKVGVYVLLRGFGTVLPHTLDPAYQGLVVVACLTMVLTILGALARPFLRGILAFNILSHIGFMILAIGLFNVRAFAGAIYYLIHHIVVMASLFLLTGVVMHLNRTDELARTGHLWKRVPWFGLLFLLQALSLSGLPPLSGFWGKWVILEVALEQKAYGAAAAVVTASMLTLFSMLKVWNNTFWSARPGVTVDAEGRTWRHLAWVGAGLTAISLVIGLGAEWFMQLALKAAAAVLDQAAYIDLVFQATGKGGS